MALAKAAAADDDRSLTQLRRRADPSSLGDQATSVGPGGVLGRDHITARPPDPMSPVLLPWALPWLFLGRF
jgi:hypothetical protein